jgi:hypothetical protein
MPKMRLLVRIQSRISVPSSSLFSSSSSLSSTLPPILASLHQPLMLQKIKSLMNILTPLMGKYEGAQAKIVVYILSQKPMLRIHEILGWIWIRGSLPLTNRSGSCYFRHRPSRCQQKTNFLFYCFCLLLFEGTFTSFFKDKKSKRVTKK